MKRQPHYLLAAHVRFEERELFAAAQEAMAASQVLLLRFPEESAPARRRFRPPGTASNTSPLI